MTRLRFKVDLDELDAVTTSLDTFAATLAHQLEALRTAIAALQQDWRGDAAEAQEEVHRRLAAGAADLHQGLVGMHAAARKAHDSYLGGVHANQATWKQVR